MPHDNCRIVQAGHFDKFKASVHLAILVPVSAAAAYNTAAYLERPCWRLACNALVYWWVVAWEVHQIRGHLQ